MTFYCISANLKCVAKNVQHFIRNTRVPSVIHIKSHLNTRLNSIKSIEIHTILFREKCITRYIAKKFPSAKINVHSTCNLLTAKRFTLSRERSLCRCKKSCDSRGCWCCYCCWSTKPFNGRRAWFWDKCLATLRSCYVWFATMSPIKWFTFHTYSRICEW